MSKKGSSSSFIAGGIIGAAIVYLTCTDKGKVLLKEGLNYLDGKLDECFEAAPEDVAEEEVKEESETSTDQ